MQRSLVYLLTGITITVFSGCEWLSFGSSSPNEHESNDPTFILAKETNGMFTGHEDHSISLLTAKQMTKAFQADNPFSTYGWFFGRDAIESILAKDGVVGIRIYGGLNAEGGFSPVVAGTFSDGTDFLATGLGKTLSDSIDNGIAERTFLCPPDCP